MGYYLSGGAPSYFTIKPMSDLFILRPDSLYFDLENIDQAFSHGFPHIGIEYQSEWGPQNYDEDYNGGDFPAFHQIMDLCHNALWPCIWLVDYNLKRKANAPPYKSGCFYAGDRKFIVVDFLEEDSRDHWEYIEPVPDGDYQKSSFYFAEQLHQCYKKARKDGPEALFNPTIELLGWDNF